VSCFFLFFFHFLPLIIYSGKHTHKEDTIYICVCVCIRNKRGAWGGQERQGERGAWKLLIGTPTGSSSRISGSYRSYL
jgi:hypothetical protein